MSRIYKTKDPDKILCHAFTVPITESMRAALKSAAAMSGLAMAEVVRNFIQKGLEQQGQK